MREDVDHVASCASRVSSTETPRGSLSVRPVLLTADRFGSLKRIAASKCFGMTAEDRDDMFGEACLAAVRVSKRSGHLTNEGDQSRSAEVARALSSEIYFHAGRYCNRSRRSSVFSDKRSSSGPHIAVLSLDETLERTSRTRLEHLSASGADESAIDPSAVADQMAEALRQQSMKDAVTALAAKIPPHLFNVFQLRNDGMTNTEIARHLGIPAGTVQYYVEEFRRRALQVLGELGLTCTQDFAFVSLKIAA